MEYLLFLCIMYVLPLFTEQQLILLKPRDKMSHENNQLDPASNENSAEEMNGTQSGNQVFYKSKLAGSALFPGTSTEEEIDNNGSGQSKSTEEDDSDGMIFILQIPPTLKAKYPVSIDEGDKKIPHWSRWVSEIKAGHNGDISGTNPRIYQPDKYSDFGRRFVPQYQYSEKADNVMVAPDNKEIIPIQAPLEIVKKVAKQSVLEEAAKPQDNVVVSKALRTGDYWNAIWVEDVDPKSALRMSKQHVLGTIKAKIKPGSEFYDLVSSMTKISPRLLYVINDKKA